MTTLTAELLVDRLDPGDVVVSPDGRLVALVVTPVGRREEVRRRTVWLGETHVPLSARPFTSGVAEDTAPQFAPDGSVLYFLSDRAERTVAQLHRICLDGGEAEQLTDEGAGVAAYAPLASGTHVVFLAADAPTEEEERRRRERDDARVFGEWRPHRLRLLDLESGVSRTLEAPGRSHVHRVVPGPAAALVAVVLWETPELDNLDRPSRLAAVDVGADEIVGAWPLLGGDASVVWTGERSLCVLAPLEPGGQAGFGIFVTGLGDGPLQPVASAPEADPIALAHGAPVIAMARGLDCFLARLEGDELVSLRTQVGTIYQLGASADGSVVACALHHSVPDVWAGPPDQDLVRVSDLAPELAEVEWGRQERLAWRALDDVGLDGLLVLPPRKTRGEGPFPLVVLLHGGPYGRSGDDLQLTPFLPAQWLAAAGYAVFCPNPRGGFGHGATFVGTVRGAVGVSDWPDVDSGLDELVREGVADPERLGVGGWSQGGYMTAWGVTQTTRFSAAVTGAGPSDWGMMVAESDLPTFEAALGGSTGWEGPGPHRHDALSPISYAQRVTTPVLILHGEEDKRVPVSQARFFAAALRAYDAEFELVTYPREPHVFEERSHLLDLLHRWRDWLVPRLR